MKYLVGIDEAGRGPLAGPLAMGAVKVSKTFDKKFWKGIRDSKKLTKNKREEWYKKGVGAEKRGELDFVVSLISHRVIDEKGLSHAIRLGVRECLKKLRVSRTETKILLDGSLHAPKEFIYQRTIVKGDEKIPVISLASIFAKVTRDRLMVLKSKKYPKYGFERHKGYGTKLHLKALKKHGPSRIHRRTFLKNTIAR